MRCSKLRGIYLTCKYNKPRVVMRSGFSGENLWKWDQEWRTLIETNLNKDTRLIYIQIQKLHMRLQDFPQNHSGHCPLFPYNKAVWVHASISMQNFNKFFSFIFFIMQKVLLFGCCVSSGNHFLSLEHYTFHSKCFQTEFSKWWHLSSNQPVLLISFPLITFY